MQIYFWSKFFNFAKMSKKPFWLRSVQCNHFKYAKILKKFDREVRPHPKSWKAYFSVRNSLSTNTNSFSSIKTTSGFFNLKSDKTLKIPRVIDLYYDLPYRNLLLLLCNINLDSKSIYKNLLGSIKQNWVALSHYSTLIKTHYSMLMY